jgi:hypothetical protein
MEAKSDKMEPYLSRVNQLIPILDFSLAKTSIGERLETPFLEHADLFFNEFIMLQPYKDQVVLDLGAGAMPYGIEVSQRLGASAYIAVEPYFSDELRNNIKDIGDTNISDTNISYLTIPYEIIPEDMLTFLRRVSKKSVSILCSGIDECIINSGKYITAVEEEIARVLHPKGAFINYCSLFNPRGVERIYNDYHDLIDEFTGIYKRRN